MELSSIADRTVAGDVRAAARLMRDLEDERPEARRVLRELLPRTGRAYVIGLTGAPGTGKSSLVDRIVTAYRESDRSVGVVAVDPTSPFSGGALLGDRIRMQDHSVDPGVFIRSMATRGHLGGLSRATAEVVSVMDAMGKDVVLVETVGVGQDELEIATLAHTVVVVTAPGLGDDVQALKESVLEIADVFAVNKSDREGAERAVRYLAEMLQLRVSTPADSGGWMPPIVKTVAVRDEAVPELAEAIDRHRRHLESNDLRRLRDAKRARAAFVALLRDRLLSGALEHLAAEEDHLDALSARIAAHELDPYELADAVAARLQT